MSSALSSKRSWIARIAVLGMLASLLAFGAAPASAAIATDNACPSTIASAGFTDLAGVPAAAVGAIDCIASYGVSTGTTATTFDPFADVTRWQMALFLTRVYDIENALPTGADQGFTDLAGVPAAAVTSINQLAQLGISTGTTATTFDPFADVERWQMALFLTRMFDINNALPSGADQGFADLAGVPASAVTAINQLAQLQISEGTSATTFDPFSDVARWAMALFLARTMQQEGIVPTGTGFIVTAAASPDLTYSDSAQGKSVKVTTKSTDKFFVDGVAATQGAFFASAGLGDLVAVSSGQYSLTNKTTASYTTGVIDVVNTGANTYAIVEPITGTVINTVTYDGPNTVYSSDGSAVGIAGFEDDVQAGDTVVSTGTGANAANIRTLALTNKTVSGTAAVPAAGTFTVKPFADVFDPAATDSITIDATVSTEATFNTELTPGDDVTVAKNDGKLTITLVNKARTAIAGKVLNNDDKVGNTVDVDGSANEAYAVGNVFIVNGVIDDIVGFEDAHTAGDDISIVRADGKINTVDRITLTDAAFSGTPEARVGTTVSVKFKTGGDTSELVDYALAANTNIGLSGTLVKYSIPGNTAATQAQFTAAVDNAIVNGGTVSVAKVGNDLVWTLGA